MVNKFSSKLNRICQLDDRMSASIPRANSLERIYATMNIIVSVLHRPEGPFALPNYAIVTVTEMHNPLVDKLKIPE